MSAPMPRALGRRHLLRLVAWLVLSLVLPVFGMTRGIREVRTLTPEEISSSGGFRYLASEPASAYRVPFEVVGDSLRSAHRSLTQLYEDDRRLGPPHRPHDYILEDGGGQFSHWGATLFFSTTDNSDPRVNGRRYAVETAATLRTDIIWLWLIVVAAAFVVSRSLASASAAAATAWLFPVVVVVLLLVDAVVVAASLEPSRAAALGGPRSLTLWWDLALLLTVIPAWQFGQTLAAAGGAPWRELAHAYTAGMKRVSWLDGNDRAALAVRAVSLIVPVALFIALLLVPLPAALLNAAYFSFIPIAVPASAALWWCHRERGWAGTAGALTVTLGLFALPLASLWQHFGTHYNAVGGLLPFSDASGYYYDARRLIDGYPLGWSARRPLFVGTLATIFALTGQNLQVSLAVFVALNGVAAFFLARALRNSHGPAAATLVTLVSFMFYRVEGGAGTTLTENLGFALGCLAFAAIWRGARGGDLRRVCLGTGLLTMGLMARAGTFFTLPALVVGVAWAFRSRGWIRAGVAAFVAVAVAAAVTLTVGRRVSNPTGEQTPFSNFSYSLYGLVAGGKGWNQVLVDHPDAQEGRQIYSLAVALFKARPMGLVEGSLKMWRAYLRPGQVFNAFAFMHDAQYSDAVQVTCFLLAAVGLAAAVRGYRRPENGILLAATAGHLSSIPFVPPIDAGLRVYAATIPILAILVATGGVTAWDWIARRFGAASAPPVSPVPSRESRVPEIFAMTVAVIVFAGPLSVYYLLASPPPVSAAAPACPAGTRPVAVRVSRGSFLRVVGNVPDVGDSAVAVPDIRQYQLQQSAASTEIKNDQARFVAGQAMVNGYDLRTGLYVWLVAPAAMLSGTPGVFELCGHDTVDGLSRQYGVFYADSLATAAAPAAGGM